MNKFAILSGFFLISSFNSILPMESKLEFSSSLTEAQLPDDLNDLTEAQFPDDLDDLSEARFTNGSGKVQFTDDLDTSNCAPCDLKKLNLEALRQLEEAIKSCCF